MFPVVSVAYCTVSVCVSVCLACSDSLPCCLCMLPSCFGTQPTWVRRPVSFSWLTHSTDSQDGICLCLFVFDVFILKFKPTVRFTYSICQTLFWDNYTIFLHFKQVISCYSVQEVVIIFICNMLKALLILVRYDVKCVILVYNYLPYVCMCLLSCIFTQAVCLINLMLCICEFVLVWRNQYCSAV